MYRNILSIKNKFRRRSHESNSIPSERLANS